MNGSRPYLKLCFAKRIAIACWLTLLWTVPTGFAGSVAAPYEVGTWEGFRPAAVSYTFDDNLASQYATAVPMFHAAGFRMTLNTVINYWTTFTWAQAQTAASYGDEIASHTVTHTSLNTETASQLTNELAGSQNTINSYITNESCITLAYPNCAVPDESVVAQYYVAARGCSGALVPSTPTDFMNISSIILGNTGIYTNAASINGLADNAASSQGWCVYLIHALDNDNGYSPLPSSVLQASVNYMSTNQSKFWVDTFGNVVRYIKERNAASVSEVTNTGDNIIVQVTDNLDNTIFHFPITVRRPLPTNWTWAAVSQNGAPVPTTVYTNSSFQLYVMFDVVPNGGNVTIAKILAPGSNFQLVIPSTATGGQGVLAGQGSITINPAPTNDLVVTLTSGNTNKVTVPSSVVIPAGQSNAVHFDLTILDNGLLDGDQNVAITAIASGYGSRQSTILVTNSHTATLTVTLPANATKGAGTLANAGTVSASSVVTSNYTVNLASSDPSKLGVPASVVIPAGQSSAPFNLTVADNTLIDGPQVVIVTAHIPRWTDGSNSMSILDYHAPPDHFVWNPVPSPQFAGQPFTVTNTACDSNNFQVNFMLPVNLNAWTPGPGPATNSLLGSPNAQEITPNNAECTVGYSFTPGTSLVATGVVSYFGDKVSLWTDSGALLAAQPVASVEGTWVTTPLTNAVMLLAGVTYRVGAHVTNNGTFYWDDNLAAAFPHGTINDSWSIAGDAFPNGPDSGQYLVDLRYGTNVVSVPINPVVSGNFNYGVWRGSVAVLQPAANVTLQSSIPGHSGQSLPFSVVNAPKLTIVASGDSVVISWPVAPAGFNLYQSYNVSAGSWTAVTNSPATVGGNYVITNTPSGTATYYRLGK
jgi:oligosaccharide reducing-end xylanase